MDPLILAVFAFILLLVLFIGGFVLLFPVMRRLGAYLENELERRRGSSPDPKRLEAVQDELRELRAEVERLAERQAFADNLLSEEGEERRLSRNG